MDRVASKRFGTIEMAALAASLVLGFAIAWVDNRANWDDTGITAFALLAAGGVMGLLVPRRPWLWALAIWIFLPGWSIAKAGTVHPGMAMWLIVLAFPMAGALAGALARRGLAQA